MTKKQNQSQVLKGHRAVVTGASSGIGTAIAKYLGSLGADLVIVARRADRLEELAKEIRAHSAVEVECIPMDLKDEKSPRDLFEKATHARDGKTKNVTILVNNAGIGVYGAFVDMPLTEHLETLQINARVPTELSYLFIQHMLKHQKQSYILQVSSMAAYSPVGYFTSYSASKVYLKSFSETLAYELRNSSVSVTCLCPGGVYTEFFDRSGQSITEAGRSVMMSADDVARISIQGMLKKKLQIVPGWSNDLACFLVRFLPLRFRLWIGHKVHTRAAQPAVPKI